MCGRVVQLDKFTSSNRQRDITFVSMFLVRPREAAADAAVQSAASAGGNNVRRSRGARRIVVDTYGGVIARLRDIYQPCSPRSTPIDRRVWLMLNSTTRTRTDFVADPTEFLGTRAAKKSVRVRSGSCSGI